MDGGRWDKKQLGSREAQVYEISNRNGEKRILKIYRNANKAKSVCDLTNELRRTHPYVPTVKCEQKEDCLIMPHLTGDFFQVSNNLNFLNRMDKNRREDKEIARDVIRSFKAAVGAKMTDIQGFFNAAGHGNGRDTIKFIDVHVQSGRVLMPEPIEKLARDFNLESEL